MRIGQFVNLAVAPFCATAALLASGSLLAGDARHEAKVGSLMQRAFPDLPGKEGLVLMVEYPPGNVDPPHRHDAHAFVYGVAGSIEMQLAGGVPVVLKAGDTFYEGPQDVHIIGRNLSKTKPAKLVVFLVKNQNTPPVLPPTRN